MTLHVHLRAFPCFPLLPVVGTAPAADFQLLSVDGTPMDEDDIAGLRHAGSGLTQCPLGNPSFPIEYTFYCTGAPLVLTLPQRGSGPT